MAISTKPAAQLARDIVDASGIVEAFRDDIDFDTLADEWPVKILRAIKEVKPEFTSCINGPNMTGYIISIAEVISLTRSEKAVMDLVWALARSSSVQIMQQRLAEAHATALLDRATSHTLETVS